jgi:hypothetical protein
VKRQRTIRRAKIGAILYAESPARTPTKKVRIYPSESTEKKTSSNGNKIRGRKQQSITPPSTVIRLSHAMKGDVTVCTQWFDVRKTLDLAKDVGKNIPSLSDRQTKNYNQLDSNRARYMITFVIQSMDAICNIVYTKESSTLVTQVVSKLGERNHDVGTNITDSMKLLSFSLPPRPFQRLALLVPICIAFNIHKLMNEFDLGARQIQASRAHYRYMGKCREIVPTDRQYEKYSNDKVHKAVDFILSESNVQMITWGTKTLLINSKEIIFPRLTRKKIMAHILRSYVETFSGIDRIGVTSPKQIVKVLRSHSQKANTAVDHVSGLLVYDNFVLLRRICDTSDNREKLKVPVDALETFLKGGYDAHVRNCCVTKADFGLSPRSNEDEICDVCSLPNKVIGCVRRIVDSKHHVLLLDCRHIMKLYCAHRIHVLRQRKAIDNILETMPENKAHVVLDFKTKFEAMYYREKMLEFYGKKGLS